MDFGFRSRISILSASKLKIYKWRFPIGVPLVLIHFDRKFRSSIIEGSLEVKLPTICTDGKAEVGRAREEKIREEKE